MGGSCHRGLRHGAEFLLEDAKDDLLRALKRNKGYRLVLCGHSLGGGMHANCRWRTRHCTMAHRKYSQHSQHFLCRDIYIEAYAGLELLKRVFFIEQRALERVWRHGNPAQAEDQGAG